MKRHGNLWDKITSIDNLKLAHKNAKRGKSFYSEVKMVDADPDRYMAEIQRLLVSKQFSTSAYKIEDRFDGRKMRTIYKLPYYPDRIVQHALLNVVGPILVNSFIRDTFQSIEGRGTYDAMKRVKAVVRADNRPKYALKVDIHKYYPSIDNEIMKAQVRRKIKCPGALWLLENIVDSMQGLPIGNYTSQHLGNLYLNEFDWWVKQELRPQAYFRYCDDIVFMGENPKQLVQIKHQAEQKLAALKIHIKPSWNIYNVETQGIDFVGYVFRPNSTTVRKNIAKNFKKTCRKLTRIKVMPKTALNSIMAYKGWFRPASAKRLWRSHLSHKLTNIFPRQLKGAL
jgi:hypothetical protein